jgi:hypothetical protein
MRHLLSGFTQSFRLSTGHDEPGAQRRAGSRFARTAELLHLTTQPPPDPPSGVTRASVTIVFDNSDKETSPLGYEEHDKITVTRHVTYGSSGASKYLIDGHTRQLKDVHSLFQSVQLNIDNPTFLVQQGHITKVVSMKPPEVMGLLAEATGVALYEAQKVEALKGEIRLLLEPRRPVHSQKRPRR